MLLPLTEAKKQIVGVQCCACLKAISLHTHIYIYIYLYIYICLCTCVLDDGLAATFVFDCICRVPTAPQAPVLRVPRESEALADEPGTNDLRRGWLGGRSVCCPLCCPFKIASVLYV